VTRHLADEVAGLLLNTRQISPSLSADVR
jgi:hypothetical protein